MYSVLVWRQFSDFGKLKSSAKSIFQNSLKWLHNFRQMTYGKRTSMFHFSFLYQKGYMQVTEFIICRCMTPVNQSTLL